MGQGARVSPRVLVCSSADTLLSPAHTAAHLNKAAAPQPRQPPINTSAESIRGPARQPPSNRSSQDGAAAELDRRPHPAAAPHAAQQQQGEVRLAASISRFQPMGQQHYALAQAATPRRSAVAVSQLGGGSQRGSTSVDENLAAAALATSTVRGAGLPPRHGASQQQQALPVTKRSLDSMRASMAGGAGAGDAAPAAAQNIKASLHAVEAAMAALCGANPHLSQQQPPAPAAQSQQLPLRSQQAQQQRGRASQQQPPRGVHHTRARSLPESSLDLPLHELSAEEHQRRRRQEQAAAAAAARPMY